MRVQLARCIPACVGTQEEEQERREHARKQEEAAAAERAAAERAQQEEQQRQASSQAYCLCSILMTLHMTFPPNFHICYLEGRSGCHGLTCLCLESLCTSSRVVACGRSSNSCPAVIHETKSYIVVICQFCQVLVCSQVYNINMNVQAPKEAKGTRSALRIAPGAAEDEKRAHDAVQAAEVGSPVRQNPRLLSQLAHPSCHPLMCLSSGHNN